MFPMFLTFLVVTSGLGVLLWFGFHRIAMHLRGNREVTRAVFEHVLIPLFGRKGEPEFETGPDGKVLSFDADESLAGSARVGNWMGGVHAPPFLCPERNAMTLEERLERIDAMLACW